MNSVVSVPIVLCAKERPPYTGEGIHSLLYESKLFMINLLFSTVIHMMTQSTSFTVLVAVLIISTPSYCSTESVYCVTSTATSCSSCPHNSANCTTLKEYAQEAETYFTSNTTMVFLPGDHVLDRTITVVNVTRLTMHGEFSSGNVATVVRNGSVGFSFTNMVDFNIYFLAFTSYNRSLSYRSHSVSNSALFLQSTPSVKLVNCSFHDNLGTALAVNNTNITLAENSKFIRNQCACQSFSEVHGYGCGIAALNSNLVFTGKSFFCENTQTTSFYSYCAGTIWASGSSLHFNGTNNFNGNSANEFTGVGGAIYATSNTKLSFSGTSNFTYNSAGNDGGAITTVDNVVVTFHGTNNFIGNTANNFGGAIAYYNGILNFHGTNNNSAWLGGAILADSNSHLSFSGTSDFSHNSADYEGGAIYADINSSLNFIGTSAFSHNSADYGGGAIDVETNSSLSFSGSSNFSHNSANYEGGAIHTETNSSLNFIGTGYFSHNSAQKGGAIHAVLNSPLSFIGVYRFSSNSALKGGAIFAYGNSSLMFDGSISFTNNGYDAHEIKSRGGAINLGFSSTVYLMPNTTVYMENNHASLGGGIYVFSTNPLVYCTKITKYIPRADCFFQLPGQNLHSGHDIQLVFENNSADDEGSVLYGGAIDNCTLNGMDTYNSGKVFDMLFQYERNNKTSSVSSIPFRVCLCENEDPNCDNLNKTLSVYPGETFSVSVVTTGQGNETVPAQVRSRMDSGLLLSSQYIQQTNKTCTTLNYTVFSQQGMSKLELYADGICSTFGDELVLLLNIDHTCPPGFDINQENNSCVCDQVLQNYTNNCNITNGVGKITRESDDKFWVGYDNQSGTLYVHPHCPFD